MGEAIQTVTLDVSALGEINVRELIISLYGLYARQDNPWLSTASLVRLMSDLGADEASVRSSIHRLKQRGVLDSRKTNSSPGYALTKAALRSYAEGDARIFGRRRATLEDGWLLLVFSVPESQREKRHELRTELVRLNFGSAAPGIWIAPGNLRNETQSMIERHDLARYVEIFRGDHLLFGDLKDKVKEWWNFDELDERYRQFVSTYGPLRDAAASADLDGRRAFVGYVHMLTNWRRIPDPGLPLEVIPGDWPGLIANSLYTEVSDRLSSPARAYVEQLIGRVSRTARC